MAQQQMPEVPLDMMEGMADENLKKQLALALLQRLQGQNPLAGTQGMRILPKLGLGTALLNTGAQAIAQSDAISADKRMADMRMQAQGDYLKGVEGFNTAPDKAQSIAQLMASKNPLLRAFATEQGKILRDQQDKEAERERQLREAAAKALVEKGDTQGALSVLAQGGKVDPTRQVPAAPEPQPGEFKTSEGKVIPTLTNIDPKTGKKNASMLGGTNITVDNRQESATAAAFGKVTPDVLKESSTAAKAEINKLQASERILGLLKDPQIIAGGFAEPRLFLSKIGELMGYKGPEAITQTQKLLSELASQTLNNVGRLPGAITEKERPFLAQAAAGNIDYTPEALAHLARLAQVDAHNTLMHLVQQYDAAAAAPGVGRNAGMFPFPKGWKFQPDPATMEETGAETNLWRLKPAGEPTPVPAAKPRGKFDGFSIVR